jgi:hypothetical protein
VGNAGGKVGGVERLEWMCIARYQLEKSSTWLEK